MLIKLIWFTRPGIASAFTPNEGIVQECSTSALDTKIRTFLSKGTTTRLSVSNWRNIPRPKSLSGIMYESKVKISSPAQKSVYSYSQYHWWPMAFTVRLGDGESSIKYKRDKEGRAIWIRINPGIVVQIHSITWPCSRPLKIILFNNMLIIIYPTNLMIKIKIMLVKSWK